jgi:GMP synthase (glutamine-hydrolysing)
MKILLIQNHSSESFGYIETYLTNHAFRFDVFKAFENQIHPPLKDYSHLMIGGSPYSTNEVQSIPFLKDEWGYIEKAIKLELPIFGLCFGAQIIAQILGARVQKNSLLEIGDSEICLTEAGKSDSYFENFPIKFHAFQWHGETFDIPEGAELLAKGKFCSNQAYRYKNILAVQFHLEVDHLLISKWCNEFKDDLKNFHKDAEQIVQECLAIEKSQLQLCDSMLANFFS